MEEIIMAFLDDLSKKLGTAADLAVDKAKDLAEAGKLKLDVAAEEKEIQNFYVQIGKSVYHLEKDNPESVYAAECVKIAEHLQRVEQLRQEAEREKLF